MAEEIRKMLELEGTLLEDIDDDLLLLAFTQSSKLAPEGAQEKYGTSNYEQFEFLGDGVLEMLATVFVLRRVQHKASYYIQEVVRNTSLSCMMKAQDLEQYIRRTKMDPKVVADVFEALLGVFTWHLLDKMGSYQTMGVLEEYLDTRWNFGCYVDSVIAGTGICKVFKPLEQEPVGTCEYDVQVVQQVSTDGCTKKVEKATRPCTTPMDTFRTYSREEKAALLQEQLERDIDDLPESALDQMRMLLDEYM